MKKLVSIFLLCFLFCYVPVWAQWENAQISQVPSQTGTATYAKGAINQNNTAFVAWENNIGNLYFATRSFNGLWSLPELVSENIEAQTTDIASKNGTTYLTYLKQEGENTEIWLAQIKAPFDVVSNELILSNAEPKTSLSLAVDAQGIAHISWAMRDVVNDLVRVYYYNNSTNGLILGATKVPLSNMKAAYNPIDLCVTADGKAEISYIGAYINEQIVQRTFNNELSGTAWNYGTYFKHGPSAYSALKTTNDENLIYYATQENNGDIVFFQAHTLMTDGWIPESGNATVITNGGTLESILVSSSVNRHCSIIGNAGELVYAYNTSDSNWTTETILSDGEYKSGNLCTDNINKFYWIGIKDGKSVLYGPETTTTQTTLSDLGIALYPNPASDVIYLEASKPDNYAIKVYDIQGKLVSLDNFVKKWDMQVDAWQKGIYFVQIQVENKIITQKLVIN